MKQYIEVARKWCGDTYNDYVVFTKSVLFISGMIFSCKLVEKMFLNVLMNPLADAWEVYDLRRAVVIVILVDGTVTFIAMFFFFVADVYTGRFLMLLFSTTLCINGLLLNYVAIPRNEDYHLKLEFFYPALGLLSLAQAAQTVTLQRFLKDQLMSTTTDEATADKRASFWCTFISFVAAVFAQFGPLPKLELRNILLVLTSVVGGCFLLFLLGTNYYYFVTRSENAFKDVAIVILKAFVNRKVEYRPTVQEISKTTIRGEELFENSRGLVHIWPRVSWLRWLDRAAMEVSVEQVSRVKLVLEMAPLWSCFLTLSLVATAGNTFFFEDAITINYGRHNDLRLIIFFDNVQRFTYSTISTISTYVLTQLKESKQFKVKKMEMIRVGMGMLCSVPCFVAAWATTRRRSELQEEGDDQIMKMSAYWLIPQFMLLGLSGGLCGNGFRSLYESERVAESLSIYGVLLFVELVMGVGKFVSLLCILVFSNRPFQWLQMTLEHTRLDKYYIFLAVLSFGNFVIYCLLARWFVDVDVDDHSPSRVKVEVEVEVEVEQERGGDHHTT